MRKHTLTDGGHTNAPRKKQRVDPNWPERPVHPQSVSSGPSQSSEISKLHWAKEFDEVNIDDPNVIERFRQDGEKLVEWIDNPNAPGCEVGISPLTFQEVIWAPLKKDRYRVDIRKWSEPPSDIARDLDCLGFSKGAVYRHIWLRRHGIDREGHRRFTEYGNYTTKGVIIGDNIWRYHGHNWSEIVLAQYKMDFDINDLKHVYFVNVVNVQTFPYVKDIIYEQHGISFSNQSLPLIWHHNTRRYQEILGTRLGKSAAYLVLGAFPRGTHRIERIQTWVAYHCLHLRFDIEQITPTSPSPSNHS
ncbi:hypothetical protein N7452_001747 [Penicillium brevicompactum]|uniref:Uncharacterized protein n=1 Tax=Penicillium brevicompactum TaxID=5074 RepID=A0A9W9R2Y5_PENBR|nr:hypothetical protein N7452_001747 [Penicillium brevicompactum]